MGRRLRIGRVLDCFPSSLCASGYVCIRAPEEDEKEAAVERAALVASDRRQLQQQVLRLKDLVEGTRTLGFHLQPKTVELRVSMHCYGCARKVQKHISKMEGSNQEVAQINLSQSQWRKQCPFQTKLHKGRKKVLTKKIPIMPFDSPAMGTRSKRVDVGRR